MIKKRNRKKKLRKFTLIRLKVGNENAMTVTYLTVKKPQRERYEAARYNHRYVRQRLAGTCIVGVVA